MIKDANGDWKFYIAPPAEKYLESIFDIRIKHFEEFKRNRGDGFNPVIL